MSRRPPPHPTLMLRGIHLVQLGPGTEPSARLLKALPKGSSSLTLFRPGSARAAGVADHPSRIQARQFIPDVIQTWQF